MEHIVGIGDIAVSDNTEDILKTFSLSTCVGLTVYFPKKKVMGMVHIALPHSSEVHMDSREKPGKYANTAVPHLFKTMALKYGCYKHELKYVKIFGGIGTWSHDCFKIGERNIRIVKEILDSMGIHYDDAETGGSVSRTLFAHVESGNIEVIRMPIQRTGIVNNWR